MPEPITPTTFHLDVTGANGTPFRFVLTPDDDNPARSSIRYHDRRYTLNDGDFAYHPRNFNEDGQACGPDDCADSYSPDDSCGFRGWHEVDAWDVDVRTRRLVGTWIAHVLGLSN